MKLLPYKKILYIAIAIASLVFTGDVFAQTPAISNLEIDQASKVLSGTINPGVNGDISLSFVDASDQATLINVFDTTEQNFSTSLSAFSILEPQVFQGQTVFDRILVNPSNGASYFVQLSETFPGFVSAASVDFSGWNTSEYLPIAGTEKYYPNVSSSTFTRSPASTDIYLILEDLSSGQKIALESYLGGSSALGISWPVTAPTTSNLVAGTGYRVYLSTDANGQTGPINSSGQSTEVNLGQVPAIGTISISDAQITNDTNVQINAVAPAGFSGVVEFKVVGTDADSQNNNIEISLGSITNPSGVFIFPDSSESFALGGFDNYTIQAVVGGDIVSEFSVAGTGNSTSTNTSTGNTNNNNSGNGGTDFLNNTQTNIIANGIVTTDCGYNLGKKGAEKGKICGFNEAITLIQRVIEYIFILVLPIMAIVFAYAGYLYLTSGGNSTKKDAAKNAMTSAIIGVVIIMAAWLIVKTIVVSIGVDTNASWFFLGN